MEEVKLSLSVNAITTYPDCSREPTETIVCYNVTVTRDHLKINTQTSIVFLKIKSA